MIKLKTEGEIKILRQGGKILSDIVQRLAEKTIAGASPKEIDWLAENLIKAAGGRPSFKNYQPDFAGRPYPASICFSVNSVIVHGIPNSVAVEEGDIVGIDLGMEYKGLYTDMAITVSVGKISKEAEKLMAATKKCLDLAIAAAQPGSCLGDIGKAVEEYAHQLGFGVIRDLTGHGVGYKPHEDPSVYNFAAAPNRNMVLEPGLVLAIEPMLSAGSNEVIELPDGAFASKDGLLTAHFEHTIAITKKGNTVLTK